MSLKWIFALALLISGMNAFAAQKQLASDIRYQIGLAQQKTPKDDSVMTTVALEGFVLKIIN